MEDKIFELMSKIYGELSEFRKETNNRLDKLENGQKNLENGQKKIEAILENDIKNDIKALFDGYKQTFEEIKEAKNIINDLSFKLEKQEVEIKVIKGGK